MKRDVLSSARRRLNCAKAGLPKFKRGIQRWFDAHPYAAVTESNPDGTQKVHKIKFTKRIPGVLTDVTVEILEHLRASLDLAGFGVATAVGKKNSRSSYFPFGDDPKNLENNIGMNCKDLPKEIIAVFRGFKPYKGGDNLLWALNTLCNGSKHRFIEPVGIVVGAATLKHFQCDGPLKDVKFPPAWDSEKHEIVLGIFGPNAKVEYDFKLTFAISFGKVEIVGGQPVLGVLEALINKVEDIIRATESEGRRIGILS